MLDAWQADLEHRLRTSDDPPVIVAHLAKYRKLVPAVALVLHLAEASAQRVSEAAVLRAITWADYLESHARRIYSPGGPRNGCRPSGVLLARMTRGVMPSEFALRYLP